MPTRIRSSTGSTSRALMSTPSSRTLPPTVTLPISSFMRFRQRSSVDLPQPDGPMSAVTACGGMCIDTPAIAVSLP